MITEFELTITNESGKWQEVTLVNGESLPAEVKIEWRSPEIPEQLLEKGFRGYLSYTSAPALLPLLFVTSEEKEGCFLRKIDHTDNVAECNVWHDEPIEIGHNHFIRFSVPPNRKLFLAFREEQLVL